MKVIKPDMAKKNERIYLYTKVTNTLIKILVVDVKRKDNYILFFVDDEIFGMDRAIQEWDEFDCPPQEGIRTIPDDILFRLEKDVDIDEFKKTYLPAFLL